MIKVSVLIPVYNTEKYLRKCIESVPVRDDVEIIIIDDCSTDRSADIIKESMLTRPQIKFMQNAVNMGIGYNRNRLMEAASGKYMFFLDSDDWIFDSSFNYIVDNILVNQPCVKALHTNPFNQLFPVSVHRGDFLLKSFVGDIRHEETMRCHEDSQFKDVLRTKPGYYEIQIPLILYYYFEPRTDSLTWIDRKGRGYKEYQKDEDYWISVKKPWWKKSEE